MNRVFASTATIMSYDNSESRGTEKSKQKSDGEDSGKQYGDSHIGLPFPAHVFH